MIHETAAAVVFNNKHEILLLKEIRKDHIELGKWVLPGGHIDKGENAKQAAAREMREEVGAVALGDEIGAFVHPVTNHEHLCHIFAGRMKSKPKICKDEAGGYKWVKPATIRKLNVAEWSRRAIGLCMNMTRTKPKK